MNARSESGWTALMGAADYGYRKAVRILLQAGADVNAREISGDTALDYADRFFPLVLIRY